ncbi:19302_t:CDS:2 [Cetraspora pellucida]|uniref:19302_t:CDS:1 n=1 Tax=Cetraspora pellucida TaxID=1433469 RepID=A0A9N9BIL2_9GLOM|nr:19302_t:CDS:2 [Cetraspora pellucida]
MLNNQLTINILRELNSRLAFKITELRKENVEIPELRKNFSKSWKLEQKQSKTNEKNNFIVKSDDDVKKINQSLVCKAGYSVSNTTSTKIKNSNDTNISDTTSNSDVVSEQIENISNNITDSDSYQEKDS